MQFIRSNLIGLLALFVALGGTAYAVTKAPKNSVVSSSIKKGQVKSSDLANGAATGAKLGASSVDSSKFADNALTGADIDESSLALPASLANDTPPAPHEERIAIGAGSFAVAGGGGDPPIAHQFGFPAIFFNPATDKDVGTVTEVPLDRAPGTDMQVRLRWDAQATGNVAWRVRYRTFAAGADLGTGLTAGPDFLANVTAANTALETVALEIPSAAIANGDPLAIRVTRDADNPNDVMVGEAFLRMVEIRYTAEG